MRRIVVVDIETQEQIAVPITGNLKVNMFVKKLVKCIKDGI